MDDNQNQKALIYCRVSHSKQAKAEVGTGLDSQEHRCRAYAHSKGYEVEAVFPDDVSGGGDFMKRKGMVALLHYLDTHPQHNYVVIFDDLKRFARDTIFHFLLKSELASYSATLECLNYKFEDTPEGEFAETIFAAQGQLERKQNQRQTVQKMKACLERGHWPFQPPVGYKRRKEKGQTKILVHNEPLASIIQEALEGFASGRFQTQAEVMRFLEQYPEYPKDRYGKVRNQRVKELLTRVTYAGYVEHEDWGVPLTKGIHDALISYETYQKIQRRLQEKAKVPARKNLSTDFPLRGAVSCGCCSKPLTSCWSTGRGGKRYAYYHCYNEGCDEYGQSIRKSEIEGEFESLLKGLVPSRKSVTTLGKMFKRHWAHLLDNQQEHRQAIHDEIRRADHEIENVLNKILEVETPVIIKKYEEKIKALEEKKIEMNEKLELSAKPFRGFEEMFRTALEFIADPLKVWTSGEFEDRRAVLKLTFSDRLAYVRNEGFRTAKTTLFQQLSDFCGSTSNMARSGGSK